MLNLYFSPLACSLATRVALYEAGADAEYTMVDLKAKRLPDGADFRALTRMGQVPVLRTDDGELLTENTAVLQYVADRFPDSGLAPAAGADRAQLQQWLGFIGTELHKAIFATLFDPQAPEAAKAHVRTKVGLRFDHLQQHLSGREFLLERFSIADAYLATVLCWTLVTDIPLAQWPAVQAYHARMMARASMQKAFGEELALYQREQAQAAQARAQTSG